MTAKPWARVAPIVEAALLHDEQARAAFVAEACGNDVDLVREVESLLAHASGDADFLSTPALAMAGSVWSERPLAMLPTTEGPDGTPTDASRLAPGQRFGPYRIERLLGRGGMGEVYEAEHLEHGRRIALKVLSQRLSDATDRARFLREGQLAAAVSHPHVVYIYGSEEIAGMPVIAMELLPGGTLKDRVEKEGPLAPIEAIDAILQVVSGLEAAHAAGILHRDIKPSNCFVDADGTVKVGDFGLSIPALRAMSRSSRRREPFKGRHSSHRQNSCVASRWMCARTSMRSAQLCTTCLTGRPPFDDRDLMALVSRIATEPPPSPREVRPEIPRALAAVVLQCLAKDPAHRPASYRVLASVLEPLGSTVKTPAPLGIRFAAGIIGCLLFPSPAEHAPGPSCFSRARRRCSARGPSWQHLVEVAYFAITESVWGASLGKALCGFRVVTESGAPPRFARALLRALVFVLPRWFASGLVLLIAGLAYSSRPSGTSLPSSFESSSVRCFL